MKNIKVSLITDEMYEKHILPSIHHYSQLDSIYFLSQNQFNNNLWSKIEYSSSKLNSLSNHLTLRRKQNNANSISISFLPFNPEISEININELESSYMYTKIFKEILLNINYNNNDSIQILTNYCREIYPNCYNVINDFEEKYTSDKSIWWYTKEAFICELLNQALRNLQGSILISMGIFIRNLHEQIQQLYEEQMKNCKENHFYCLSWTRFTLNDFEKLQNTIDGLISFNNFLSTSRNRNISLLFAESSSSKSNTIGILFQINIDLSIVLTPFADIHNYSYFQSEEEILFSMHTIFRIKEIISLHENKTIYQVNLLLTNNDDPQLALLTDHIRNETNRSNHSEQIAHLLIKIGEFKKSEEIYQNLLEETLDLNKKSHYFNQLGYIKDEQGDYRKAIEYYQQGLDIKQIILPSNDPLSAITLNNIGVAFRNLGEYFNALSFYEKSLEIRQIILPVDHPDISQSYNNIGVTYNSMSLSSEALLSHENARNIFEKILSSTHPTLTTCYNNIGDVYRDQNDYSNAILFYEKSLAIREKIFPSVHPCIGQSYNNFGKVYKCTKQFPKALSFFEKACPILEEIFSSKGLILAILYNNISEIHRIMKDNQKALFYAENHLNRENLSSDNHSEFIDILKNIALVYSNVNDYSQALLYFNYIHSINYNVYYLRIKTNLNI
uniref:NAD(P)(+)--arginine ADP-ribosyltransferase n=1 Tax=Adineta vaga TaxID=104782 RepID=A5HC75_ADIVA|nr:hypothetical protein [Adineta vaga]